MEGRRHNCRVHELFTVMSRQVGFVLNGKRSVAEAGETVVIPEGMPHDWWSAGGEEVHALVEACIRNIFGLAQDGKTNARGMPNLLQLALFAREFDDVIRFTRPPR
jgi:hypothetical protein